MTPRRIRGISFAGVRVTVESSGEVGDGLVDLLFRDMADEGSGTAVSQHFTIEDVAPRGSVRLSGDGGLFHEGSDLGDAALKLQEAVTTALAARCTGGLALHAAAVARAGRALIFPGKSGSGKTTLSAYLMAQAFTYLSDEIVYLPFGSSHVEGLPRPLSVKTAGLHLVASRGVAGDGWARLTGPAATLLQPPAAAAGNAGVTAHPTRSVLTVVVFPRFRAEAPATCVRLTAAQAGLRLMATLLNARNLEGHGFPAVGALVRDVPAYELQFGDVREAVPLVAALS